VSIHVSSDKILQPLLDKSLILSIEKMTDITSEDVSKDGRNPKTLPIHHIGESVFIPPLLLTIR
jgi:hypothetical protein